MSVLTLSFELKANYIYIFYTSLYVMDCNIALLCSRSNPLTINNQHKDRQVLSRIYDDLLQVVPQITLRCDILFPKLTHQ